jgi:hypothetical protein
VDRQGAIDSQGEDGALRLAPRRTIIAAVLIGLGVASACADSAERGGAPSASATGPPATIAPASSTVNTNPADEVIDVGTTPSDTNPTAPSDQRLVLTEPPIIGGALRVLVPDESPRDATWFLDEYSTADGRWSQRYATNAPTDGGVIGQIFDLRDEPYFSPDVRISGPGPDEIPLPPDLSTGVWRVCANESSLGCIVFSIGEESPPAELAGQAGYQPEGRSVGMWLERVEAGFRLHLDEPADVPVDAVLQVRDADTWRDVVGVHFGDSTGFDIDSQLSSNHDARVCFVGSIQLACSPVRTAEV